MHFLISYLACTAFVGREGKERGEEGKWGREWKGGSERERAGGGIEEGVESDEGVDGRGEHAHM